MCGRQHHVYSVPEYRDEDRLACLRGSQGLDDPFHILQFSAQSDPLYHQNDVASQENLEFADSCGNGARAQVQSVSPGPGRDSLNENTTTRWRHVEQRGECSRDLSSLRSCRG